MPAAVVNVVQGLDRVQQDVSATHQRLIQTARTTAGDVENVLASAEQILRSLANQPEVRNGGPECSMALTNALKGLSYFTNLARIDASGNVLCAVVPPPPELMNVSQRPWWPDAMRRLNFFVTPQVYSVTAKREVLGGLLPLQNPGGGFDGVLATAVDTTWLDFMLQAKQVTPGAVVAVFDPTGKMIAANDEAAAMQIFREAKGPMRESDGLVSAAGPGGAWSYVLTPLYGGDTHVGFAMSDRDLFTGTFLRVATDLLLPVLMLGLASIAIWIATDRLVLQWIAYLRRIANAYAHGHYTIRPVELEDAPSEFRTLGEAFSGMAAGVQDRDRRLHAALEQKNLLIKETHHRVKNNLQIVMSLLSLQAGKLRDPVAQNALRQAQVRVNALALVHRTLHEIENLDTVDLQVLLADLVHQIHEALASNRRDLALETEFVSREVSSDIAVPLTLFTVEALTNAFKHAYPAGTGGGIRVSLKATGKGNLTLEIADDGPGNKRETEPGGIGSRLILAFAQQVGGEVTSVPRSGGGTIVTLVFPDPLLRGDEAGTSDSGGAGHGESDIAASAGHARGVKQDAPAPS